MNRRPVNRIALVFPPSSLNSVGVENSFVPNGLLSLAKQIELWRKEIEIKIFDGSVTSVKEIIRQILDFQPELLGVSALCGNYEAGKQIMAECHREGIITIIGNHHANYLHSFLKISQGKDLLSEIDFLITGNEDISVLKLLIEKIEEGKNDFSRIPNLCYKNNGKWVATQKIRYKFDTRATPDLKYVTDFNLYFQNYRKVFAHFHKDISSVNALNINFYKGCMQGEVSPCIYCCLKDHKLKTYKPDFLWNSIRSLNNKGFNFFFETANSFTSLSKMDFTSNTTYLDELAKTMPTELKGKVEFMVYARADEITRQTVEALKRMNVIRVVVGLDSADENLLKTGLGKRNIKDGMNYQVANLLNEYDVQLYGCYVPGAIGETIETLNKTKAEIQAIMEMKNCCAIEYTSLAPMPGSRAWEMIYKKYYAENGISDVLKVDDIAKYWVKIMTPRINWQMIENIKSELKQQAGKSNIVFGGYY